MKNHHTWVGAALMLLGCTAMSPIAGYAADSVGVATSTNTDGSRNALIIRGSDQILGTANASGTIKGSTAGLKFEEAPVADVVSLVLREIARVDYVLHPPISGTITLSTQGEVTADHAVLLLEAALQANGLMLARDTRGVYHIGRPEALRGIVPAVRQATGGPLPPGSGAIVVPLKHIGATEMAAILRPMAPGESILRVDPLRNLLVLSGTRTQAEGWLDVINTFDVDLLKGMSVGVFQLKNITTKDIEAALRLLNSASGGAVGAAPPPAANTPPPAGAAANAAIATPSAPLAILGDLRILPIERINSIMIVAPRASYLDEAKRWLDKLDQPGGNTTQPQLFVYAVQNGNAKHLADVLSGLFGAGGGSSGAPPASSGVAPALQQSSGATGGFSNSMSQALGGGAKSSSGSTVQGNGLTSVNLGNNLRLMADENNNTILIFGTRGEYERLEATLRTLDVVPTQVLIEASIVEVTLTDDLKYGLQWMFTDKARGNLTGNGLFSSAAGGALGATPAGFSYSLSDPSGAIRATLNALADKSLVKVMSSPSLMVLDNHTASISVGNQQPIRVGETVTTGGNVSSNIQYKDTGVSLSVTPSVNAGNLVTMQLMQAVTDVGQVDAATGQRSFLQRQFSSKVAVRSGETLVLGGLIRDNATSGKSGVPLLQDIPVVGALFSSNQRNVDRTELVVLITPKVVRSTQDVREIGQELKDRMKSLFPSVDQ